MHHQGHEAPHDHHPPHSDDHHYQGNNSITNQYKPSDNQLKLPESYYEFGRNEEKNNNKTNQLDAAVIVITDNEEVTNEAGRKQVINDLQNMNNG